jgi:hypothetical protein
MMCLMHQGTPYGHLRARDSNGGYSIPDTTKLAKMTGNTLDEVEQWLDELTHAGVIGHTKDGVIFSKKMVRDERQRRQWRARQNRARRSKTTYKPKKTEEKSERDVTGGVTPMSRENHASLPLLSSSSSSTANTKKEEDKKGSDEPVPDWPSWYDGITWNKTKRKVDLTEDAQDCLREHLQSVAAEETLRRQLTREDMQRAWGRLNGHLIGNPYKRGKKTLAPITVNWFENDLRMLNNRPAAKPENEPRGWKRLKARREKQNEVGDGDKR